MASKEEEGNNDDNVEVDVEEARLTDVGGCHSMTYGPSRVRFGEDQVLLRHGIELGAAHL